MAKRYHQSKKARHNEHMGMERYERGPVRKAAYSGYEESRRMMARDGAMIKEDMSAPALLPQHVIDQYWPKAADNRMGYVDDLFYGVQKQMHEDYKDFDKNMGPKKY